MKNMKSMALALVLVLVVIGGAPLLAQQRDNIRVSVFASQIDLEEEDLGDGFTTEFDSGSGFGLGATLFFNRFVALDAAVLSVRSESRLLLEEEASFALGRLNLVPVMVGAQFHLAGQSRIDPYIGAGAAYVMANDFNSQDLDFLGLGRIEVDDGVTYYANAGLGISITPGLAIFVDGRYIPYEPATTSTVTGVERDLELSPRILSAGLRLRF